MKITKRKLVTIGILTAVLISGIFWGLLKNSKAQNNNQPSIGLDKSNLTQTITAPGDVEAQNQANLTFLTTGRVSYLAVKEGDFVTSGEVLAGLDTTIAAHNLTAAQAQYRSAQAALEKVIDDIHLFQYGNGGFGNVGSANETQTQKTQRQEAEEAVNVAYDSVQSAKKQLDLQSIIAPFDGSVLSIQNISEGSNVSLSSGSAITIAGGGQLKFVANVLEQDIDKLAVGQSVSINLDGSKDQTFSGTIEKIAAGKTTRSDGSTIILVDVQSSDLQNFARAGQTGSILIKLSQQKIISVPSWLVLSNKYIWVYSGKWAKLKEVKVGQTVDGRTAIVSGLSQNDQLILEPNIIARSKYKLL